jgi:hypothetical protein
MPTRGESYGVFAVWGAEENPNVENRKTMESTGGDGSKRQETEDRRQETAPKTPRETRQATAGGGIKRTRKGCGYSGLGGGGG